jgi:hypothetical protein
MTKISTVSLILLLVLYVMLSFGLSYYYDDPHLANRMGASLSAIGALMIILQVQREVRFEAFNKGDEAAAQRGQFASSDRSLIENTRIRRATERHHQRMRIIVFIAIMVFVGEVLHGWADFIFVKIVGGGHQL